MIRVKHYERSEIGKAGNVTMYNINENGDIINDNIVKLPDLDLNEGIELLNKYPELSEIYLFTLHNVIGEYDVEYHIRYHIHNTGQIDLVIKSINMNYYGPPDMLDNGSIFNIIMYLNCIPRTIILHNYNNTSFTDFSVKLDNDNILISNISVLDIHDIEEIMTENIDLPYEINFIKHVNFMTSFKHVAKIKDDINTQYGIASYLLTNYPKEGIKYSLIYAPYEAIVYLLQNNPNTAIEYLDKIIEDGKNLDVIYVFIKNVINEIDYYPYIKHYGEKYLELYEDDNTSVNTSNPMNYVNTVNQIKQNKDEWKISTRNERQKIEFVNYALAHVIMSKLGVLTEDEKKQALKYLFNAGDVEHSEDLRSRLFFQSINFHIQSTPPFKINLDYETMINLGKMIKELKK